MSPLGEFPLFFLLLALCPVGIRGGRPTRDTRYTRPVVMYSDRIYCIYEKTRQEVPCLQHDNKKTTLALIISGSILGAILLALAFYVFIRRHRYKRRSSNDVGSKETSAEVKDEPDEPVTTPDTTNNKKKKMEPGEAAKHRIFFVSLFFGLPFSITTLIIFSLTPRYDPFTIAQLSQSGTVGWVALFFPYVFLVAGMRPCWRKWSPKENRRMAVYWVCTWVFWFASPLLGTAIMEAISVSASHRIHPTWRYVLSTMAGASVFAIYGAVVGGLYIQASGKEAD
ncbi:hypothetical protein DL96DRAFT_1820472 [Flagelloscypha sp. PMI_526]|nr:hypothetical protein DL96DRAFT_1820472 [Flagelloscypha sp. PMI_526]